MERDCHYVECNCTSAEHALRLTLDDDEELPAIYVEVQLNRYHGFFGRLWLAIRYVFGYECRYGHWDEATLMGDEVRKLRDLCNRHLEQWEKAYGSRRVGKNA
jgi:hypothetical protein